MKIDTYTRPTMAERFGGEPPTSIDSLRMRGEPIKRNTSGVVIGVAAGVIGVALAIVGGNFYNERHPQIAAIEQPPPRPAPAPEPASAPSETAQSTPLAPQTAPLAGAVGGKANERGAAAKPLTSHRQMRNQSAPGATPAGPRDADDTPTPSPSAPIPAVPPPSETTKE